MIHRDLLTDICRLVGRRWLGRICRQRRRWRFRHRRRWRQRLGRHRSSFRLWWKCRMGIRLQQCILQRWQLVERLGHHRRRSKWQYRRNLHHQWSQKGKQLAMQCRLVLVELLVRLGQLLQLEQLLRLVQFLRQLVPQQLVLRHLWIYWISGIFLTISLKIYSSVPSFENAISPFYSPIRMLSL